MGTRTRRIKAQPDIRGTEDNMRDVKAASRVRSAECVGGSPSKKCVFLENRSTEFKWMDRQGSMYPKCSNQNTQKKFVLQEDLDEKHRRREATEPSQRIQFK